MVVLHFFLLCCSFKYINDSSAFNFMESKSPSDSLLPTSIIENHNAAFGFLVQIPNRCVPRFFSVFLDLSSISDTSLALFSICEAYFKKHSDKIGFMRVDALSLLLCLGNVTANVDVLVVDMVGGILTGAIAERLGGTGYVCNTYRGSSPYPVDITRMFNLNDEICKRIVHASLTDLNSLKTGASVSESQEEVLPATHSGGLEEVGVSSEHGCMDITSESVSSPIIKPCKSIKPGQKAPPEAIKLWKENGFSSLIIAAPELDPWGIIKEVLPLLAFSAPFAVYHQYAQPLATCMHNLQIEKMAIGLQISEPWLREYQVLPSRTHPHMQMSAFGGYILSGTKISSSEPVTSSN